MKSMYIVRHSQQSTNQVSKTRKLRLDCLSHLRFAYSKPHFKLYMQGQVKFMKLGVFEIAVLPSDLVM